MNKLTALATASVFAGGILFGVAISQDSQPDASSHLPAPAKQHLELAKMTGKWTSTMSSPMGGDPASGTETNRMLGKYWLESSFTMPDMMGMGAFEGKAMVGYDPMKDEYMTYWFDSMGMWPVIMTGKHDEKIGGVVYHGEGRDMTGAATKYRQVEVVESENKRHFTMFMVMPDGSEMEQMRVDYTRQ